MKRNMISIHLVTLKLSLLYNMNVGFYAPLFTIRKTNKDG